MNLEPYKVEFTEIIPYSRNFSRDHFSCGKTSLDNYILKNATKDVKSGACTCFVIIDGQERVIGTIL
ncbi:MAG: hypothetical protein IPG12_16995 [Saprospiraceae bacterium]|nr:hypothetical protein [Saprospiraceae bacterium]